MKIRNGFVSNSSSSSFIMIGVDTSLLKERVDSDTIRTFYFESMGIDRLTGFVLADESEEYIPTGVLDSQDFNEKSKHLAKLLDVDIEHIKLYYGTRPC